MTYVALRSSRFPRHERRRRRNRALLAVSVGVLGLVGARLSGSGETGPAPMPSAAAAPETVTVRTATATADYAWMLDPSPALRSGEPGLVLSAPLAPGFQRAAPVEAEAELRIAEPRIAAIEPSRASVRPEARIAAAEIVAVQTPRPAQAERLALSVPLPIPLPVPRPPEFRREPVAVTARLARRPAMPSTQSVFKAARAEEPSLFERIFGDASASAALGYAAVDGEAEATSSRRRLIPAPAPANAAGTAIYDITAQRVTLPSGEVLEAHSGLGPSMDNPRNVHLSMRGATPPGTYDLREREALFHGVRAIRLNPVGGPAAINGRVGLLAHTYMLGPSGASNGCVSFRDYNRFLQAFLRGEVQRLVVVAGNGQDGPPWNGRRYGMAGRSARGG